MSGITRSIFRPIQRGILAVTPIPVPVSWTVLADGVTLRGVFTQSITAGSLTGLTASIVTLSSGAVVGGNFDITIPKVYQGADAGTITYSGSGTLAGAGGLVAAFGPTAIVNDSTQVAPAYATWDPAFANSRIGFSNGDLRASLLENANWSSFGSTGVILPGEKKCFGIIVGTAGNTMIGFGNSSASVVDNQFLGFTADAVGFFNAGQVYWDGSGSTYLPSWTSGQFILLAIDRVNNEVTLYKEGVPAATIAIPAVTGNLIPMASYEGVTGRYIDGYFDPDTFPNAAPAGFSGVTV